jgi:FkbM family methyltransferase
MKKILRNILGDYQILLIKDLKKRWLPSKMQTLKDEIKLINNQKLLYSSFIQKDDLCFDVGANIGNRISSLLEIGAKIVAVEPQDSCFKYLKYKYGAKIEIVNKGLGESNCFKDFHISNINTLSSFSDEWIDSVKKGRFQKYNWDKVVKIELTTLDILIEKYGLPVFIKIDVEGFELNVLKGLTKPIKLISFEYTVPEQINKIMECIEQIEKNGANIECNYSIGESMVFALEDWLSVEQIRKHILTKEFIDSEFGDVYVKTQN